MEAVSILYACYCRLGLTKTRYISGETPLSKSAGRGHVEVLSLLLEAGADKEKGSPLCLACASGVTENVRKLLSAGADKNNRGADGPPVYIAADKGYVDILKLVLEARANANDTSGEDTPLYRASFRGYAVTVRVLLEATDPMPYALNPELKTLNPEPCRPMRRSMHSCTA